jgi:hypothetical protein
MRFVSLQLCAVKVIKREPWLKLSVSFVGLDSGVVV